MQYILFVKHHIWCHIKAHAEFLILLSKSAFSYDKFKICQISGQYFIVIIGGHDDNFWYHDANIKYKSYIRASLPALNLEQQVKSYTFESW